MADRNANIILSLRNQASPEIRRIASDYRQFIGELQQGGASIDVAERKMLSLAQAKARALTASGQAARGEQELTAALGLVTQRSSTAYNAQTQLANIQNKLAGGSKSAAGGVQTLGQALGVLKPLVGGLGVGFGVQQLVAFGKAAGEQALELRETKNSLSAVAGNAKTYTAILGEARQQQLLFGGSLQENISGLQGLAVTSRSTGASLGTLIDLQKRLAALDPVQGNQGALVALNEALSGNVASLSRRFEIPKAQLDKLADTSLPVAVRLQAIDQFLTKVGFTSAAVAGKVDQSALAYRRLGQELGDLQNTAGGNLADMFAGAATGLSRLVGVINGNPQAIAELKAIFSGKSTITQQDVSAAARQVAASQARNQLGGERGRATLTQRLGGADQYAATIQQLAALNLAGEGAARTGQRLTQQFLAGALTAEQYRQALTNVTASGSQLGGAMDEERQSAAALGVAHQQAAQEIRAAIAAMQDAAQKSVADTAAKDAQQAKTQLLAAQTKQAVSGFFALNPQIDAAGIAALVAAGKLDPLIGQLAAARVEALNAGAALAALNGQQSAARTADNAALLARANRGNRIDTARETAAQIKQEQDLAQAQTDRINRTGTATQKLAQAQRDYAAAVKKYGKDSEEAFRAQTDVIAAQQAVDAAQLRGAKSATSELNKQLSLEERIRDAKVDQLKASLDVSAAIIRDRQAKVEEDAALKLADKRLANGRLNAAQRQAVQDARDLILIEQQQRELAIREQLATAGGQIVNGRILQGQPGGTLSQLPAIGQLPGLPQLPAIGGGGTAGGGTTVQVFIGNEQLESFVVRILRGGLTQAGAAGIRR